MVDSVFTFILLPALRLSGAYAYSYVGLISDELVSVDVAEDFLLPGCKYNYIGPNC